MQQPIEGDVDESQQVVERVAAIDVAKATGMVCVRVSHASIAAKGATKVWEVKATTKALAEMGTISWPRGSSVSCWSRPRTTGGRSIISLKPPDSRCGWSTPNRPRTCRADRRPTKIDAVSLAKLAERSMVSASFVPAEAMRHVRDLARARFDLVDDRTRVKQPVGKLLEDARLKISSVLSDIHGVSGRAMIEALIAGERDPDVFAGLAERRARAKMADLAEAVEGCFTDHHARLARMLLDQTRRGRGLGAGDGEAFGEGAEGFAELDPAQRAVQFRAGPGCRGRSHYQLQEPRRLQWS